ncbi:hypothetical protein E7744_14280 [Citricoccus sp. SGAir0253]|uniref:hypothetical protein n=1 Tax=Citricoccus sp. SGAir0253 TaxID=2567881 RepID=UPI0010CCD206|nr:hypothetical protein [Citricoccus sp. SGAir0253]QCU79166.1 hypothetical protein E7744_14280 [Citricoccus sp. SGAir0253]
MITVLPSPLLPAVAYADLLAGLRRAGLPSSLARAGLAPGEGAGELVRRWSASVEPGTILLAHSNAGFLAPLVRRRIGPGAAPGTPIVFVDAALPAERGEFTLAPEAFRVHLAALAGEDGMLPPWTRWWPRQALAQVIPEDRFEALDSACPRLPLAYFDTRQTAPGDWTRGPNAYLAFRGTYAEELESAHRWGWPTAMLDGGHLAWLAAPDDVAAAVVDLVGRMGRGTAGGCAG